MVLGPVDYQLLNHIPDRASRDINIAINPAETPVWNNRSYNTNISVETNINKVTCKIIKYHNRAPKWNQSLGMNF